MITIKNEEQIGLMRKAGRLLYEVLQTLKEAAKPGVTTQALNDLAEQLIRKNNAIPSFLGYEGFPASLCASPDDMVVHGIPSKDTVLRDGMLLSLDCGLVLDGWQADSALTVGIGTISTEAQQLIDTTERCFFEGAWQARAGHTLGDIGHAVQACAERQGFSVIRDLTGHGIGRDMHEDPSVYNFGRPGKGLRLRSGMTLAIEPMIAAGSWRVQEDDDGWGVRTMDGSLCSHYEHTMAIYPERPPELLTLPGFDWQGFVPEEVTADV